MQSHESSIGLAEGFSARDDYKITVEPLVGRVRAMRDGKIVADSNNAVILNEPRHYPAVYFPRADVDLDQFEIAPHWSNCPYKGDAKYWQFRHDAGADRQAAWSYENPPQPLEPIRERIAFYSDKVSLWFDGVDDNEREDLFIPGYGEQRSISENVLISWAVREAWSATTTRELVQRLVGEIETIGIPLVRANVILRTLHPLLMASGYRWWRHEPDSVDRFDATHDTLQTDEYRNSPVRHVLEGHGSIRRRIDAMPTAGEFSILSELRENGATDYVALPMAFSDGQLNVFSLATSAPDGFSDHFLADLLQVLPILSRCFEVHSKRRTAATLLETFIGKNTGERVLNGQVRRGDGDDIDAVIWFCDLRNSTPIANSMSRAAFLRYLNIFFDAMAGSVVENGGEVLRFIGDAVLAIFPFETDDVESQRQACQKAVDAARETANRVAVANDAQLEEGMPPIGYGIGLHVGDVTFGNIGIPERLEFTVIGAAANEAARIESMTKDLSRRVIVSKTFADAYEGELEALGAFELRGVEDVRELFALPEN